MLSFVKKDDGRQEADIGKHDDLVMASAIAHFARSSCDARYKKVGEGKPDFIDLNFKTSESEVDYVEW